MTRLRLSTPALSALLALTGFGCAVAGLFLLAGLAVTMIVAGVIVCVAALVVDLG